MSTPIAGWQFGQALIEAGVITPEERVRRIVIDAPADGPVVLYVERYGDDRLLQVATTLRGVTVLPAAEGQQEPANPYAKMGVVSGELERAQG